MVFCNCYKHLFFFFPADTFWSMKGRSLKISCKLMIVVWLDQWLDLLLVLVNMLGLFHFHGMEALGKEDPDISCASYEHFGTKRVRMRCVNSLTCFLEVLCGQGVQSCPHWCCSEECLSSHWALSMSRKYGQLWHKDQEHWALTDCVLCSAGRITGSRGSTRWKSLPVSRTTSAGQPELVLWAVLAACPFPCWLTHPHSALSLSHSTSLLKWHLLLHWIFSLSWIPHSW